MQTLGLESVDLAGRLTQAALLLVISELSKLLELVLDRFLSGAR
jgi:hypothetical protein